MSASASMSAASPSIDPAAKARAPGSRASAASSSLSSSRPAAISVAMVKAKPPVALIAGPTASGKSALALMLAEATGGAVINADSAQIYRDLPILSAAPSAEERGRAEHLLYGVLDGAQPCSAADWAAMAKARDRAAARRGPAADPGRRYGPLFAHIAGRHRAGSADRSRDSRRGARRAAWPRILRRSPRWTRSPRRRLNPGDTTRIARALEVVLVDRQDARRMAGTRAKAGSATTSSCRRWCCSLPAPGSTSAATGGLRRWSSKARLRRSRRCSPASSTRPAGDAGDRRRRAWRAIFAAR